MILNLYAKDVRELFFAVVNCEKKYITMLLNKDWNHPELYENFAKFKKRFFCMT